MVFLKEFFEKVNFENEKFPSMQRELIGKKSKKDSKDQESIQSSTTPVPGHHMGK